ARNQSRQAFAVARDGEGFSYRPNMHIQAVLRYIDPDLRRVHPAPALLNRARVAAHTTVRVRGMGKGRARLSYGLASPRMSRSSPGRRTGNHTRCDRVQLTRVR